MTKFLIPGDVNNPSTWYLSAGNDLLSGDIGTLTTKNDIFYGFAGDDTLSGVTLEDTLLGYDGSDVLNGGSDADLLLGGVGDDVINGGAGDDVIYGGYGIDTVIINRDFANQTITFRGLNVVIEGVNPLSGSMERDVL